MKRRMAKITKLSRFTDQHFLLFLLIPTLVIMFVVVVYPLIYSIWLSVTNATLLNFKSGFRFIGVKNYIQTLKKGEFWSAFRVSVLFSSISTFLEVVLGFILAYLVYRMSNPITRSIVIACLLAPLMLTPVVVALMWKLMLDYQIGIINYLCSIVGLGRYAWLGDQSLAFWSIVVSDVWQQTSFAFLILLAGLESLPQEPFEAAKVDGASALQTFRYLTLPFMSGPMMVAFTFRLIDSFKIFDKINVLTGGGPGTATETLNVYMHRVGFRWFFLGEAASVAQIIVAIIMLLTLMALRIGRQTDLS